MFKKVLIGVVLFNNSKHEIDNFRGLLDRERVDVIFWNNGSYEYDFKDEIILSNGKNLGFGAGHNKLYETAQRRSYEFYVCSNLDVHFTMSDLELLMESWAEIRSIEICTPKIVENDRVRIDTLPRFTDKLLSFLGFHKAYIPYEGDGLAPIQLGSGCFFMVNLSNFREPELFDERFFMYEEDTDLYRRCWSRKSAYLNSTVQIFHGYAGGSKKKVKLFLYHFMSLIKYYSKWPSDILYRP